MKSEIEEFWEMTLSEDIDIQDEGFDRWIEYEQNHPEYITILEEKLSKKFYSDYKSVNFHDFQVIDIIYKLDKDEISEVEILLYDYFKDYGKDLYFKILYKGVEEYFIKKPFTNFKMFWGNDIFEVIGNGLIKHRIQCADGINLCISFKNISIEKETRRN